MYPYVGGDCEKALRFWAEALGGRVKAKIRISEAMPDVSSAHADWIVHWFSRRGG